MKQGFTISRQRQHNRALVGIKGFRLRLLQLLRFFGTVRSLSPGVRN